MGMRETGFQWTCDWCNKTDITEENAIPEDWTIVQPGALFRLEPEHLCSDACWHNIRHADLLAHELAKEVDRMVRRRWEGKGVAEIPEASHVDLRFVIDGEVVMESE